MLGLLGLRIFKACGASIDRAVDGRTDGPILLNTLGTRTDRHTATRRLKHLAATAGVRMPRMHPHMLRHTRPRPQNLDRHPNYILAAFMASGTERLTTLPMTVRASEGSAENFLWKSVGSGPSPSWWG
jgi:integrase